MDKKSAAELLGVTPRSVENYARDGKLSVTYIPVKNGKQADYSKSEVLALKEELKKVVHRSIVTPDTVGPNTSEEKISEVFVGSDNQLQFLRLLAALVINQSLPIKLTLSLDEAAQLSGLTRSHLANAAKSGQLNARKIGRNGGWRVREVDLQEYINKYYQ